jgi:hypothetical protein
MRRAMCLPLTAWISMRLLQRVPKVHPQHSRMHIHVFFRKLLETQIRS